MGLLLLYKGEYIMSRKKQKIIDVTGLSTSNILNREFEELNKLSTKNLKAVTSRLVSSANKRLKRIEKANLTQLNIPYKKVMEEGKFSVKGKNRNQVLQEYARAKEYLESKTSSVSGYKSYRQKVKDRLGIPEMSDEEELDFWNMYNDINAHSKYNKDVLGSNQMQRIVAKMVDEGKSKKQILSKLRYTYQQEQKQRSRELNELLDDEIEL